MFPPNQRRGRPLQPLLPRLRLVLSHFAYTHTRGPLAGKRAKPDAAVAGGDLMDTALAFRLVDELAAAGVNSITWTGGGEPTLHPDFDAIVERAQASGLEQGIYTHGGHLPGPRASLLKRAMTFVYVSLDAWNAEAYKRDKGVDRFDAACDGIRRLAAAEGPAAIGIGYLITAKNWGSAGYAAQLPERLGADYVQFRPTVLYEQDAPGEAAENTDWLEPASELLARVADTHPTRVIVDIERFRMYRDWQGHGYPTCWWSTLQTVVTPNGKVWTCVNLREHPSAEIGDLSVETFADIWARRPVATVGPECRIMCRGHVANTELERIFAKREHTAFV